jgi:hypothetical protein
MFLNLLSFTDQGKAFVLMQKHSADGLIKLLKSTLFDEKLRYFKRSK